MSIFLTQVISQKTKIKNKLVFLFLLATRIKLTVGMARQGDLWYINIKAMTFQIRNIICAAIKGLWKKANIFKIFNCR